MRRPILMLSNTSESWEKVGEKVRAHSYFGSTSSTHTISVHYMNLRAGFKLQGTLSNQPTEADWFDIHLDGYNCCTNGSYVEYPRNAMTPTGENGGDSGVDAFTFVGNFTYLRAVLYRKHINEMPPTPFDLNTYGVIDKVLLSL